MIQRQDGYGDVHETNSRWLQFEGERSFSCLNDKSYRDTETNRRAKLMGKKSDDGDLLWVTFVVFLMHLRRKDQEEKILEETLGENAWKRLKDRFQAPDCILLVSCLYLYWKYPPDSLMSTHSSSTQDKKETRERIESHRQFRVTESEAALSLWRFLKCRRQEEEEGFSLALSLSLSFLFQENQAQFVTKMRAHFYYKCKFIPKWPLQINDKITFFFLVMNCWVNRLWCILAIFLLYNKLMKRRVKGRNQKDRT